jgi:hypothetical protein
MAMKKFWLVWNESGYFPKTRHPSEESAVNECARLCKKEYGKRFFVLEALGVFEGKVTEVSVDAKRLEDPRGKPSGEIPF